MNKHSGSLFYLSEDYLESIVLKSNGKISFYTTIEGCLASMHDEIDNKEFYVYIADNKVIPKMPSKEEVPNVNITHERWVFIDTKIRYIGKIRVEKVDNSKYTYTTINEME